MRYCLFLLSCLLFYSQLASATSNDPTIHTYLLNNGLRVIVQEDHRSPIVISDLWYRVGSSDESNGITGISHVLEHMMFEGTKTTPEGVFTQLITQKGGIFNAETDYDFTHYYEEITAAQLPLALKLEADRMQHLQMLPQAFKKELQVVLEERRMRTDDNPQALLFERFMATANISTPYHHSPIGWFSDILHLRLDDLTSWYNTWYAPNNATLLVIGDVIPRNVFHLAEQYFGAIPKHTLPLRKPHPAQNPLGEQHISVNLPAQLPVLLMGYSVPVLNNIQPSWEPYALSVLAAILSAGDSARLPRELIKGKAIASEASASYSPYSRYTQQFMLFGIPAQGHSVDDLRNAFLDQIHQLQTTLISRDELTRIINQVAANKIYDRDSISAQARELGTLASLELPLEESSHYLAMIKEITPAQLQAVAIAYLDPNRLTEAQLHPQPLPST